MRTLVYIGTQASEPGKGVFAAWLDEATGALEPLGSVAQVDRPTWVLADPSRRLLFATSEVGNAGDRDGAVVSFAYDVETAALREVARTSSGGGGATHLDLDARSGTLFVANYGGGQAGLIPVAADGTLASVRSLQAQTGSGPHRRQQGPHPHGVTLDPSGRVLLVPDMGADRIYVYDYDPKQASLAPAGTPVVETPAGSGPRLMLFGSDGRFVYLLTELSAELFVYRWDAGRLEAVEVVALDDGPADAPRSAAAITISADGRFLYASNRRTDMIQAYAIDRQSGGLSEVQRIAAGGAKPWCAALSPSGRWLLSANQGSDQVSAFAVDPATGLLGTAGEGLPVPTPTGLAFA